MSEPLRWREDSDPAVAQARALLRAARASRPMSAEEQARVSRRVMKLASVPAALSLWFWVKGVAFGASLAVATLVVANRVVPLFQQETSAQPAPVRRPQTSTVPAEKPFPSAAVSAEAPPVQEAVVDAGSRPILTPSSKATAEPPVPTVSASTSAAPVDSLTREIEILEQARQQLASNPAGALRLAEDHALKFPNGKLSVERELVAVDALRRLGRAAEARARGEALLSRAKGSIYEDRVRKILADTVR